MAGLGRWHWSRTGWRNQAPGRCQGLGDGIGIDPLRFKVAPVEGGQVTVAAVGDGATDADDVTGDTVLSQAEYTYDAAGNQSAVATASTTASIVGTAGAIPPGSSIAAIERLSGQFTAQPGCARRGSN